MAFIEYPKWLHGAEGASVLVDGIEAELALEGQWFQSPAEAMAALADGKPAPPRRGRPPRVPADE